MNSIRNAPVEVALIRIENYLRTHNYDDCALYLNRLHSNTFRKILVSDLSFDNLLSQLPFSIEIFEVIYSKIFLIDPESFPLRILKPDRLLSKMISHFTSTLEKSSSSNSIIRNSKELFIDDERLLSNLGSILRIISYVQPILFKRLVHQKETIDQCVLYFEQRHPSSIPLSINLTKSSSMTHLNLEETIRHELESTITCCQQALHKLTSATTTTTTNTIPMSLGPSSAHSTPTTRKKRNSMPVEPSTNNSVDDIQKRLYQHKAILNQIEPYLSRTKLYPTINNLTYKVTIDKQILLAYAHIKTHEKQIPTHEPLLPLFKRFAFAYERKSIEYERIAWICFFSSSSSSCLGLIQLWRRVTDSALIDECTDDIVIDDLTVRNSTGICFERVRSRKYMSIREHS